MKYIHSPLPPHSFRLLCVEPSNDGSDALQCSLKIVSFDNPPTYYCLSYTWANPFSIGTPQRQQYAARDAVSPYHINCDGQRLDIGQNLFDALSTLRDVASEKLKSIWIDATCINQQDTKERGQQVARMADIYRNADSVVVWLGAEDEHTSKVAETAHILQQSHEASEEVLRGCLEGDRSELQSLASKVSIEQWEATIMLLCRPWFSRLWVIQEICLAHDIRIFCGRTEFSWFNIIQLAYSCSGDRTPYVRNDKLNYLGAENDYRERLPLLATVRQLFILKTLIKDFGLFGFRLYEYQLCSFIRGQYFCSDPRDLIYGLRGICDPALFQQDPDYEKSVKAIFTEFTALSIEFNQDLRILKFIEDTSNRKIKNLPSWVPDFTAKKHIADLQNPNAHHSLSQDVPAPAVKGDILNISAIKAENVAHVVRSVNESFCSDWGHFLVFLQSFSETYPTQENLLNVVVLVLTAYNRDTVRTCGSSDADYCSMFFNYIQYNFISALICEQDSPISQKLIKSLYEDLRKLDHKDIPLLPQWSQIDDKFHVYDDALRRQCWQDHAARLFQHTSCYGHIFAPRSNRVFRTSSNYMGIGTLSIQPGDEIWLTPHLNTPLILRPLSARDSVTYEFVGEAYVHGISRAEVAESDSMKFQRIQIT